MGAPTRYENGVTNVGVGNPLSQLKVPDPTQMHLYFDDFDTYTAGQWTVTVVGTTPAQALVDEDGGVLKVTNSAADNDSLQAQKVGESFLMASGKKAMFKARFKVSDATQSDFLIGLAVLDTTLLGATAGDGVTDGIFFAKDDGATGMYVSCQKDATTGQNTATSIHTVVADTYMEVAWYYDGAGNLEYFVDGTKKGTLTASSTYLPDTELTVSWALMNGEAAAKTMSIDYIFVAKER